VEQFFTASSSDVDFQKLAAIVSTQHQLAIISGGPGTGKTWTVSRILALLLQQNSRLQINLAAPTGKAAARMAESIHNSLQQLDIEPDLQQKFPANAHTLHRLLHIDRHTHRPRYHPKNPLQCDVLVLDEASMIDQQMMAMICSALPARCKLILLGDKDQLASVEAGSVFADLCGGLTQTEFSAAQCDTLQQTFALTLPQHRADYALADQVVVLQKSHRFDEHSGIGKLARLINQGDAVNTIELLRAANENATLRWRQPGEQELAKLLQQQALGDSLAMMQVQSIEQAFEHFHRSQILSAVWKGPTGVDAINDIIENTLKQKTSIAASTELYRGKPLMMTSNAYQYGIHNGDIGIVWPDDSGELKVWFEQSAAEYRSLSISQCAHYKTAYAMTVHKSQGSEFSHILLLLPDNNSAVATRELFYTGITRAAQSVEIWASEASLYSTIERKTERVSGLLDRLRK
jgi:exodeoxyribonuclease V alpha subunit